MIPLGCPTRPKTRPPYGRLSLPLLLLFGFFYLTACVPATASPTTAPTQTPQAPTATVEFPTLAPTATEGRDLPTAEAPEPLAGAGDILYQADFSSASDWPLGQDSFGTVSLSGDSLSVVIPQPSLSRLIRSPAPPATNFILDVELRSEVCRGTDEFGLAFLLSPDGDHMRFTVTCEGGFRLRRIIGNDRRAWVPFVEREPAILPSAPAENRLTVRIQGSSFRLYVNGFQVLSGSEPSLSVGGTGLVASSSPSSRQLTVLFESFRVYELEPTTAPVPTGTEPPDG